MKSRRLLLTTWLIGSGAMLPLAAGVVHAQSLPRGGAAVAPGNVTASLLDNANYWRSHGDLRVALKELERVLSYAPKNPDILAAAAEVALELNDYDAAARYRGLLSGAAPDDPRNQTLAAERQRTPQEIETLTEARRLAQGGKSAEAVAAYKALLHGPVPASLAIEYYTALGASSQAGFDEANKQLGALADRSPGDARLQLAYAKLLTLQEGSRSQGIKRLSELAGDPDVVKAARQAWREVLLWQGASEKARTQLSAYLRDNPTDPQIEAKQREFDAVLPDDGAKAMIRGYYAMTNNDVARAEQQFRAALGVNPNNPDAMVMLAAIRRSQRRDAEAQILIDKAVAIAPERRDELVRSAGGEYTTPPQPSREDQLQVVALTTMGKYDDAEQLLTRLIAGRDNAGSLLQLGDLQLRAGHVDAAGESFNKVRLLARSSGDATCGLAAVAVARGRYDEADALYAEAATQYAKAKDRLGPRRVAMGRASLLRAQAAGLDDAAAVRVYQTAIAVDPANSQTRADLAALLQRQKTKADIRQASQLASQRADKASAPLASAVP